MSKNQLLAEAILISTYCDIIIKLMQVSKEMPVGKIIVFAYIMKKNRFTEEEIYKGNTQNDVLFKFLSGISGAYEDLCEDFEYIFKSIDLLINNNNLKIEDSVVKYIGMSEQPIYVVSKFIKKAILESSYVTERQFIKEVMHIV